MVSGDGHRGIGFSGFGCSAFGNQESGAGCRRLTTWWPKGWFLEGRVLRAVTSHRLLNFKGVAITSGDG